MSKPLPGRPPPRRPGRFIRIGGDRWWTMSSLKELVAKQKQQMSEMPTGRAEVVLGGELVTFEFTKLQPQKWLDLAALHPPRAGSSTDANIGFNVHTLARAYPAAAVRQVVSERTRGAKGKPAVVSETLVEVAEDDYVGMFDVLDAIHIDTVGTVLWAINVWQDRMVVAAARKASKGEPSKKPSSPEN